MARQKAEGAWPDGWRSGFCCVGQHEGTKPKGAMSGRPMKVCTDYMQCRCECHIAITKMFETVGAPRVAQDNPDYQAHPVTWWMPSPEERYAMKAESLAEEKRPVIVPSVLPGVLPPTAVRQYDETPSGQRQRGQLEDEVKLATDAWVGMSQVIPGMEPCTTKWIAHFIDGEDPPSTGAVHAVLERWKEYGFATLETKPARFTGYTKDGVEKGLHTLRAAWKARRRQVTAAIRR